MLKQKIIYQLDEGAYKPVKAHEADAGFDLFAKEDVELSPDKTFKVDTGVIDAGYTGSISVVLVSKYDLKIFAGNRIAQLVIAPLPDVHLVEGDVTGVKSERGLGGFGSSGL